MPTVGSLADHHVLSLAQRITNKQQLQELGLKVLKLEQHVIDAALYNEQQIQDAAHSVLKTWRDTHEHSQDAYRALYTGLAKNGWRNMANELKEWATAKTRFTPHYDESKS